MSQQAGRIGPGFIRRVKASSTLAAATILSVSCAGILTKSDNVLVGDSLAARIYYQDRFDQFCQHVGTAYVPNAPPQCLNLGVLLNEWAHANTIASQVIADGALPAPEKAELKRYLAQVETLSP